ncbi:MAG: hypothetical protein IR159_03520 [Brevundimonas sp.]|nr:hypothetical protein [Brevundimonas sp.]
MAHPSAAAPPPWSIAVDYWRDDAFLLVRFATFEENDWIDWPSPASSTRQDALWRTTCFEVFVETPDGYREYNLSPSSEWASYRFDAYRKGMRAAPESVISKGIRFEGLGAQLEAQLELPQDARRLGFSAVIHTTDDEFLYWALAHPSAKPDFHHPDSFVLDLP